MYPSRQLIRITFCYNRPYVRKKFLGSYKCLDINCNDNNFIKRYSTRNKMSLPLLIAFDFDHTISDKNSDIVARQLIPPDKVTKELKDLYENAVWTTYMAKVFEILYESKVDSAAIKSAICNIPSAPKMEHLLRELHSNNCETIIISDSNTVFIEEWLVKKNLKNTVAKVYTNPAGFDDKGMLKIQMYHYQDWCDLSEKNMCKGHILESHLEERKKDGVTFERVAFVGDGVNDLCPILKLSKNDLGFARVGYKLAEMIDDEENEDALKIKCKVVLWENGEDILKAVEEARNS